MESICRLCCTTYEIAKMKNLFTTTNRCLVDKLNYFACFTFRINEKDGFPPYICNRCTGLLDVAYEFKMICESAEANFWALSQSNDTDVSDDDSSSHIKHSELMDDRQYRLEHLEVSVWVQTNTLCLSTPRIWFWKLNFFIFKRLTCKGNRLWDQWRHWLANILLWCLRSGNG